MYLRNGNFSHNLCHSTRVLKSYYILKINFQYIYCKISRNIFYNISKIIHSRVKELD